MRRILRERNNNGVLVTPCCNHPHNMLFKFNFLA